MKEEVLVFGETNSLVGILTHGCPVRPGRPVVLFLNAGITHRVGPNRLYVKTTRRLAQIGFSTFRFDFSGIGDSPAAGGHMDPGRRADDEVRQAMDRLEETLGIGRFVLAGLCYGANRAFGAAQRDSRVAGAILTNPVGHLTAGNEAIHDSLKNRAIFRNLLRNGIRCAFDAEYWAHLFSGEVDYRAVIRATFPNFDAKRLLPKKPVPGRQTDEDYTAGYRVLHQRGIPVIHIFSQGEVGLDYLRLALGKEMKRAPWLTMEVIKGADHSFTPLRAQDRLVATILRWVRANWI